MCPCPAEAALSTEDWDRDSKGFYTLSYSEGLQRKRPVSVGTRALAALSPRGCRIFEGHITDSDNGVAEGSLGTELLPGIEEAVGSILSIAR